VIHARYTPVTGQARQGSLTGEYSCWRVSQSIGKDRDTLGFYLYNSLKFVRALLITIQIYKSREMKLERFYKRDEEIEISFYQAQKWANIQDVADWSWFFFTANSSIRNNFFFAKPIYLLIITDFCSNKNLTKSYFKVYSLTLNMALENDVTFFYKKIFIKEKLTRN